ncbi:MAG: thioredoxin domain-containing protein, partial [Chlamydiota bacterium]
MSRGQARALIPCALAGAAVIAALLIGGPRAVFRPPAGTAVETPVTRPDTVTTRAAPPRANRLSREKSPYLLQHSHNPVDWYPWGEEAFRAARRERKPVFLSIGYSTCHWCHVMEKESFEDERVAALLNGDFIAIKVDREERPDIDRVYMEACAAMTGSGGWPLTILMTPDGKPFFAGTYLPKTARGGMPGLVELLERAGEAWRRDPAAIARAGEEITAALRRGAGPCEGPPLGGETIRAGFEQLRRAFDPVRGGFGGAPKFPSPHTLAFLLRYASTDSGGDALAMVEKTLDAMARGGICDQIGFGFHRYSVDAEWRVPHFEKMLYDQAMLAIACTEACLMTGSAAYEKTARGIFDYVLRDMTSPDGAFYSAEDADSEGEEGRFYVWTPAEVKGVLGEEDGEIACRYYGVTREGNFEGGASVLHISVPLEEFAKREKTDPGKLHGLLDRCRERLLAARGARVRPHRDDKILADWNGLMIAALAKGAAAFDEPRYAASASRAADFILAKLLRPDGSLFHRYRDGAAAVPGFLDDYAFLSWGLLELYEASFETRCLADVLSLTGTMLRLFRDEPGGGFFFRAAGDGDLILRSKEAMDGPYPSGNSIAVWNLMRLGRLTGDTILEERAEEAMRAFAGEVGAAPAAHAQFLSALHYARNPAR